MILKCYILVLIVSLPVWCEKVIVSCNIYCIYSYNENLFFSVYTLPKYDNYVIKSAARCSDVAALCRTVC